MVTSRAEQTFHTSVVSPIYCLLTETTWFAEIPGFESKGFKSFSPVCSIQSFHFYFQSKLVQWLINILTAQKIGDNFLPLRHRSSNMTKLIHSVMLRLQSDSTQGHPIRTFNWTEYKCCLVFSQAVLWPGFLWNYVGAFVPNILMPYVFKILEYHGVPIFKNKLCYVINRGMARDT